MCRQHEGDIYSYEMIRDSRTKPQGRSGGDRLPKEDWQGTESWEAPRRKQVHQSYKKLLQEGENN